MPSINRQTVLMWSGYTAFFFVCFTLFAYFTFPYDRLRDVLVGKISAASTPGTTISIGGLGPHWLTGVALTSVKLERKAGSPNQPTTEIAIDKLKMRASPLALLFGSIGFSFDAAVGHGGVTGRYDAQKKDGPTHTQAELNALDLTKLGLSGLLGVPVQGLAGGTVDVTLAEQAAETQGSVDLRIEGLRLGDGKAKVQIPGMGGLTLERIDAGTLTLRLAIKEGVATIERLEAKGKDLELSGSGSIRLLRPLGQSRVDITLGVKFENAYTQRNDRTKAMFELMGANPLIGRSKGADGKFRFTLSGPLDSLRAVPAGPGPTPPAKSRGKGKHGG
jgi:type II secretion system protein N